MTDIMEYKCPSCGGAMEFDSKTQNLKCPFCDSQMSIEEFQKLHPQADAAQQSDGVWEAKSGETWSEGEADGMRVYACQSCGGEIVADETTGATTCPFCGNRVVMKGQFSGDLRPNLIIPFKLDKKDAKAAYQKHIAGKAFLPSAFKKENHIDEIKGVYVPFWLFDADVNASIVYNAENMRVWENGDTEYTEHSLYKIFRSGSVRFQGIPADGSKKMDDALMESIEPYNSADAVPFQTAYLAGYAADRYDVDMDACFNRARYRIRNSAETGFAGTVQGYDVVRPSAGENNIHIARATYSYALYPVWLLNTTWKGKKYTFAMNGQTGKMVGDLPVDNSAFWRFAAITGVVIAAVLYGLSWMFLV